MDKKMRKVFLYIFDVLMINITFLLVLYLHYEGKPPFDLLLNYISLSVILTLAKILIYNQFKLYNSILEFASIEELVDVVGAVTVGFVIEIVYFKTTGMNLYFGILFFAYILEVAGIASIRFSYRILRRFRLHQSIVRLKLKKNLIIVGSGATASMIAKEIREHPDTHGHLIGFVELDRSRVNRSVSGVRIIGEVHDIEAIVQRYGVKEVIIALPTASKKKIKEIIKDCKRAQANVQIIPGVREVIDGQVSLSNLQEFGIDELLDHKTLELDEEKTNIYYEDKSVLIVGGGQIGAELSRKLCEFGIRKLTLVDIYENRIYDLQNELIAYYPNVEVDMIIASMKDKKNILDIMEVSQPDIVYQCAGYTDESLLESNPEEAVYNNVIGHRNVVEAAAAMHIKELYYISSNLVYDEASMIGGTCKINEMIIDGLNHSNYNTKYTSIRLGQVLGKEYSIVSDFLEHIKEGEPLYIAHKDVERDYISISEAVKVIIECTLLSKGNEIFTIDMKEPTKLYNLAYELIEMCGLKPHEDVELRVNGLKPNEKLSYERPDKYESLKSTSIDHVYKSKLYLVDYDILQQELSKLEASIVNGDENGYGTSLININPSITRELLPDSIGEKITSFEKYRVKHQKYKEVK